MSTPGAHAEFALLLGESELTEVVFFGVLLPDALEHLMTLQVLELSDSSSGSRREQ